MYNSDMVLYFLKEYLKRNKLPKIMVDSNVRTDYNKLRHLIIIDKGTKNHSNGNFSRLKQIIEDNGTTARLQKNFPLEKIADENNFVSLLFYFGLLTVKGHKLNRAILTIPNETIRRLYYYYDYISEGYHFECLSRAQRLLHHSFRKRIKQRICRDCNGTSPTHYEEISYP